MLPIVRWMDPREFPASDITLQCDFSTPTVGSPACFILSRNTVPVYSHAHRISLLCIKFSKDFCLRFQFFTLFYYLFIYIWLCQVFIAAHGFSLVVAGGGSSLVVACGLLLLQSMASRCAGSVIVAHRLCCPKICGASGNLPRPGIKPVSPALAGGHAIFSQWTTREPLPVSL